MKQNYRLEDCEHIMRESLAKGGTFRFYPKGTSMLPFICQGRDMVVLSPLPKKLKRYQAILYKRENGAFVLHRIIRVHKDSFTMRGDNQFVSEPGISREAMIGIVKEIIRGEEMIDVFRLKERLAVALWVESALLRRCWKKLKSIVKNKNRIVL